jgi:hypothetical protein
VRLPDFICVGPGRTGTTWIHAALSGHVGLPLRVKETRFWGLYYDKGLEWYADHFRHCDPSRPVGEACPYFPTQVARERIARHLPNCKIIVTLRDPVERSYSQYRLLRRMGLAKGTFEEELQHPRIVETNRYGFHLRGWLDLFGPDNVQVLLFDDLKRDPQNFLDQICEFIQIPKITLERQNIRQSDINSHKYLPRSRWMARRIRRLTDLMHEKRAYRTMNFLDRTGLFELLLSGRQPFPPLSLDTEFRLRERLLPEIEAVEALTSIDLKAWKDASDGTNQALEVASGRRRASGFGRREIAAIAMAFIPLATGAVPDGLDLGSMRFNPVQMTSVLEDGDDHGDDGALIAALA